MDTAEQLASALADRYQIRREIGKGGMATVFLAHDVKHDRLVALRVLDPELGAVLGADRFLAEIKVTAHLQHPNLLPLSSIREKPRACCTTSCRTSKGKPCDNGFAREKQLPVDTALHLATTIAGAVDYAHRHGVIHRDLKPENILLHEGQAFVADFGIALAVSNAGGSRITQTGLSLGTRQSLRQYLRDDGLRRACKMRRITREYFIKHRGPVRDGAGFRRSAAGASRALNDCCADRASRGDVFEKTAARRGGGDRRRRECPRGLGLAANADRRRRDDSHRQHQ